MSKNILIIYTSPRRGSNSETLADEFARGAADAGNNIEKINTRDKDINFCKGCLSCQKTKQCVIKDDACQIIEKMLESEVIVFATPIYFYEMCGQMKTVLDRTNPLFSSDYAFRDVYLIATAADTSEDSVDGAIKGLQGWIDCFEKTELKGVVKGLGLEGIGAIAGNPSLHEAYELGKSV